MRGPIRRRMGPLVHVVNVATALAGCRNSQYRQTALLSATGPGGRHVNIQEPVGDESFERQSFPVSARPSEPGSSPGPLPTNWRQRLERLADPRATAAKPPQRAASGRSSGKIPIGDRNNSLFTAGLRFASLAKNVQQLVAILEDSNHLHFEKPLPVSEVTRAAISALAVKSVGPTGCRAMVSFRSPPK